MGGFSKVLYVAGLEAESTIYVIHGRSMLCILQTAEIRIDIHGRSMLCILQIAEIRID